MTENLSSPIKRFGLSGNALKLIAKTKYIRVMFIQDINVGVIIKKKLQFRICS